MFQIEQTGYQLGAFINDLNLTEKISDEDFESLYKALSEYEVLFFRDQKISFDNHRRFASAFGSMQTHPAYPTVEGFPEITILENDKENPSKIEEWHTDMTFKKNPPLGSILIGKIIPVSYTHLRAHET